MQNAGSVYFRGTAHPAQENRQHLADLTTTEISVTRLGCTESAPEGTPLLYEHDPSRRVGTVTTSWHGVDGELRVCGVVDEPVTAAAVKHGDLRGLSLGTLVLEPKNDVYVRRQVELSLCRNPARESCWITDVDGAKETWGASQTSHSNQAVEGLTSTLICASNPLRSSERRSVCVCIKARLPTHTLCQRFGRSDCCIGACVTQTWTPTLLLFPSPTPFHRRTRRRRRWSSTSRHVDRRHRCKKNFLLVSSDTKSAT